MLLNLIKHQPPDVDKIHLHVKDPFESKYQFLINSREKVGNPKVFIHYSRKIDGVYGNLEDYNPTKKRRVFDDMIADMESNKESSPIVTELFSIGRKINISLVFVSGSYFKVHKTIRLNATDYSIMKIPNKREL